MTVKFSLQAHDVWFFRTSRPFGATQAASSDGESDLLPSLQVIFGAIRTCVGEYGQVTDPKKSTWSIYRNHWSNSTGESPAPWIKKVGPPSQIKTKTPMDWPHDAIHLRGCLPAKFDPDPTPLFPAPSFVVAKKDKEKLRGRDLELALPRTIKGKVSRSGLNPVVPPKEGYESRSIFLSSGDFLSLMRGRELSDLSGCVLSPDKMAAVEPRIGIARDIDLRVTRQGELYSLEAHRWKTRVPFGLDTATYGLHGFVDNVSAQDFPNPLVLHLGGEQRLAWGKIEEVTQPSWFDESELEEVKEEISKGDGWWLSLATPAFFQKGWLPEWVKENPSGGWHAEINGQECGRLCGLLSDPPQIQSGWDLVHQCPKPLCRLMPVGATWFFRFSQTPNPEVLAAIRSLQGTCWADHNRHAGYGLTFVGAWKEQN